MPVKHPMSPRRPLCVLPQLPPPARPLPRPPPSHHPSAILPSRSRLAAQRPLSFQLAHPAASHAATSSQPKPLPRLRCCSCASLPLGLVPSVSVSLSFSREFLGCRRVSLCLCVRESVCEVCVSRACDCGNSELLIPHGFVVRRGF